MDQKRLLQETANRMRELYEYSFYHGTTEADGQDNGGADMMAGGDPNAMGGDPNAMGGDPNAMGGAPMGGADPMAGGDPNAMGGADPMAGGDPNAMGADPMAGGDPNAMGGEVNGANLAPNAGEGADMGMDDGMGGMDDLGGDTGATPGPDDDVVDITELTDAQDQMAQTQDELSGQMSDVNQKLTLLAKVVDRFTKALDANDEKLKDLQRELVKRNPTDEETMNVRVHAGGNPFDQKPEEFWRKFKDINNHYNITANNEAPQYQITKGDIDAYNEHLVADEFDDIPGSLKEYFVR